MAGGVFLYPFSPLEAALYMYLTALLFPRLDGPVPAPASDPVSDPDPVATGADESDEESRYTDPGTHSTYRGLIPTFVGNTSQPNAASNPGGAHPHLRGEHFAVRESE